MMRDVKISEWSHANRVDFDTDQIVSSVFMVSICLYVKFVGLRILSGIKGSYQMSTDLRITCIWLKLIYNSHV